MKLTVKTLKGKHFEITVQSTETVMAVKKNIENIQGKDNYPCGQQLLIHNGKVLKDETTLAENKVCEDGFLVVMLSKSKASSSSGVSTTKFARATAPTSEITNPTSVPKASIQTPVINGNTSTLAVTLDVPTDVYGQAASHLVAGNNLEQTIQQIMDIGGGSWDKETVVRALRAAFNNPERAVDYLYSGIPETMGVAVPVAETGAPIVAPVSGAPNSSPLNMFPQEALSGAGPGSLDFLRNNAQFQVLRSMVQGSPQILQPMLQELGKQNPHILRLIQDHHAEFLQLLSEPVEGSDGELYEQQDQDMPHAINVTPDEEAVIERLETMGFDRALVIEAFLACDRNEELAANYLLEHSGDYED